ncbi:hypothetical protein F2Q68_00022554 [Brassica cretica]|uniref:Uncharacterized protein n=1 Tax=Brassica cretica TaxID=69181 RepID=A0A8S9G3Z6_BRACR|nr:hypothetical protein F2Q68_00022554 [Brassica cretica]
MANLEPLITSTSSGEIDLPLSRSKSSLNALIPIRSSSQNRWLTNVLRTSSPLKMFSRRLKKNKVKNDKEDKPWILFPKLLPQKVKFSLLLAIIEYTGFYYHPVILLLSGSHENDIQTLEVKGSNFITTRGRVRVKSQSFLSSLLWKSKGLSNKMWNLERYYYENGFQLQNHIFTHLAAADRI